MTHRDKSKFSQKKVKILRIFLLASAKQVVVQVFVSCIADGFVRHPFPIQPGNGFGRLSSGKVIVKVAVDVLVPVQPFQALFQVVDGVQHHKVA